VVQVGQQSLRGTVRQGSFVKDSVGVFDLAEGLFDLQVLAAEITGEELFRLRSVILTPE
jgi:hypothetical protein